MDDGGDGFGARLLARLERIETRRDEIARLKEEESEDFKAAKAAGFDAKVMRQMLRERGMDAEARKEFARKCQLYRAALGMLDGTPLGDAARRGFEAKAPPKGDDDAGADAGPELGPPPPHEDASPEALLAARAQGAAAAKAGRKVTENPFGADDPRRAAWDEGWCAEAGSDGMDIPAAFRRSGDGPKRGRKRDGGAGKKGPDA